MFFEFLYFFIFRFQLLCSSIFQHDILLQPLHSEEGRQFGCVGSGDGDGGGGEVRQTFIGGNGVMERLGLQNDGEWW